MNALSLPSPEVALAAITVGLVSGLAGAWWVSRLRAGGVRVAYTRKLFHIVIFSVAALVHTLYGLGGTLAFGSVVAALVLIAVWRGDGHGFYEALARDKDRPRRSLFIVVPLVTTAVGGLAASLATGPFAAVGYLAAGWGDAAGEPVGARWGSRPYRVPSMAGVPATRTVEGSLAVFLVATVGSAVALASIGETSGLWWAAPACGLTAALVEAVSNHGLDNLTVQIAPSVMALLLLG